MEQELTPLRLTVLDSECATGACPTVYEVADDPTMVAIQGYVRAHDRSTPNDEDIVVVPKNLLVQVAAKLQSS